MMKSDSGDNMNEDEVIDKAEDYDGADVIEFVGRDDVVIGKNGAVWYILNDDFDEISAGYHDIYREGDKLMGTLGAKVGVIPLDKLSREWYEAVESLCDLESVIYGLEINNHGYEPDVEVYDGLELVDCYYDAKDKVMSIPNLSYHERCMFNRKFENLFTRFVYGVESISPDEEVMDMDSFLTFPVESKVGPRSGVPVHMGNGILSYRLDYFKFFGESCDLDDSYTHGGSYVGESVEKVKSVFGRINNWIFDVRSRLED